jgi:hypothetical protein
MALISASRSIFELLMKKPSGGDLLLCKTDGHSMGWELCYVLFDGISSVNNDVISFAALNFFPFF